MPDFWMILAIAGGAALASPLGGLLALWRKPTTIVMSIALGLAAGTLLGAVAFKMVPDALENASLAIVTGGFVAGFRAFMASTSTSIAATWPARKPSSVFACAASTGSIRRAATRSRCLPAAPARRRSSRV